uniref:Uncharacterized protein n=2 Tax=Arion vulgaris TaxID=1028688 RepID=A0A0B7B7Y2_9EUPU
MTKYYSNILAKQNQQPRTVQQMQPRRNAHSDKRQMMELARLHAKKPPRDHHKSQHAVDFIEQKQTKEPDRQQ